MTDIAPSHAGGQDADWSAEQAEWLEAIEVLRRERGDARVRELLANLREHVLRQGVTLTEAALNTPYRNTIDVRDEPAYPGNIELERQIENVLRWNAVAMVLQAYDSGSGVGGHIATYLSASTMMEVGFNHIFRGRAHPAGGDLVSVQAHAAPGVYARAFLEGRLDSGRLKNFRRELAAGGGLPSYPHPRRMPGFWPVPTASMGLSTPTSIYMARFARYLELRGLKPANAGKIWTFIGDGESDEPEVLGTIGIAARERLDNLVLVVNCNLQRLDGPVRGNGKIIQELERSFRGAGWHVLKVIWGGGWDPLLARDAHGVLQRRMDEAVDGDYQYYTASAGDVVREHWVEDTPELRDLMKTLSDEEIRTIRRGGHDHRKVYAAFEAARHLRGKPVVILVKTVKGDGLGPRAEGRNTIHQKKALSAEERVELGRRLGIPLSDGQLIRAEYYRPEEDSDAIRYLRQHRQALGGPLPERVVDCPRLQAPSLDEFGEFLQPSRRDVSTTMVLVRLLSRLLRHDRLGRYIVPIVPDEARTFGMDGLFAQAGIFAPGGQRYVPVDADSIAPYREAPDGQILQEGICETGAMASFLAAGTAYANHGLPMIPFYTFYSMFGFQRVGDMIWACGDMLCRGFLIGGTSGRTTLNGEGLQHQDGHSQLIASSVPSLISYDPAFAHELVVIIRDGIRRMYECGEDVFYYLTVTNQKQAMPGLPAGSEAGIVRGLYRFRALPGGDGAVANLVGSGAIMLEVLKASDLLAGMGVRSSIWSMTSAVEVARDAQRVERRRLLGTAAQAERAWIEQQLDGVTGVFVVASDYMKSLGGSVARWIPGPLAVLGTDGFGFCEDRAVLRDHFEVSAAWIAYAALALLEREGSISPGAASAFADRSGLDRSRPDPLDV